MISKRKTFMILVIFILSISGIRLAWYHVHTITEHLLLLLITLMMSVVISATLLRFTAFGFKQFVRAKNQTEVPAAVLKQANASEGSVGTFPLPLHEENSSVKQVPTVSVDEVTAAKAAADDMTDMQSVQLVQSKGSKPRILAVDDDFINLSSLTDLLASYHYEITRAASALEALDILERQSFDLVITDATMPQVSGYELTQAIRQRFSMSELPILLITTRRRSEDILAGFQSGANDYVTRPIDAMELQSRVFALTQLKRSTEDLLRLEAAWLQAQIQPHFIVNTVNSIAALGTMDISKMQRLLLEFSNYLRTSFDHHNSEQLVAISRELSLVRSYLYIEKERFGERLKVIWDINEQLHFLLPPLSIQTLVENAVNHGVLQRIQGGEVTIIITESRDSIEICITDNGVGMSEDKVKQLLDMDMRHHNGIGLQNTNRRLKQMYGQHRGLRIESTLGQGTKVSFNVPK